MLGVFWECVEQVDFMTRCKKQETVRCMRRRSTALWSEAIGALRQRARALHLARGGDRESHTDVRELAGTKGRARAPC